MPRGSSDSSSQSKAKAKKVGTPKVVQKKKLTQSAKKTAIRKLVKSPVKTLSNKRNLNSSLTKSKKFNSLKLKNESNILKKVKKKDLAEEKSKGVKAKEKNNKSEVKDIKPTVKKQDKILKQEKKTNSEKTSSEKLTSNPTSKRGRKRKLDEEKSVNSREEGKRLTEVEEGKMNKKTKSVSEQSESKDTEEKEHISPKCSSTSKLIIEQSQRTGKRVTRTLKKKDNDKNEDEQSSTELSKPKVQNEKAGTRKSRTTREKDKASEEILAELAAIKAGTDAKLTENPNEDKCLISDESSNKSNSEKNVSARKTRQAVRHGEENNTTVQEETKSNVTKLMEKKSASKVPVLKETEETAAEEKLVEPTTRKIRSLRSTLKNKESENEDSTDSISAFEKSINTKHEETKLNEIKIADQISVAKIPTVKESDKTSTEKKQIEPSVRKARTLRSTLKSLKGSENEDSSDSISLSEGNATTVKEETKSNETMLTDEKSSEKVSVKKESEKTSVVEKHVEPSNRKIRALRSTLKNVKESENEDSSDSISASEFSENDSLSNLEFKRKTRRTKEQVIKPIEKSILLGEEKEKNISKNETAKGLEQATTQENNTNKQSSKSNDNEVTDKNTALVSKLTTNETVNSENEKIMGLTDMISLDQEMGDEVPVLLSNESICANAADQNNSAAKLVESQLKQFSTNVNDNQLSSDNCMAVVSETKSNEADTNDSELSKSSNAIEVETDVGETCDLLNVMDNKQTEGTQKMLSPQIMPSVTESFPTNNSKPENLDQTSNKINDSLEMVTSETLTEVQSKYAVCPDETKSKLRSENVDVSSDHESETSEKKTPLNPTEMQHETLVSLRDAEKSSSLENCTAVSSEHHVLDMSEKEDSKTLARIHCSSYVSASPDEDNSNQDYHVVESSKNILHEQDMPPEIKSQEDNSENSDKQSSAKEIDELSSGNLIEAKHVNVHNKEENSSDHDSKITDTFVDSENISLHQNSSDAKLTDVKVNEEHFPVRENTIHGQEESSTSPKENVLTQDAQNEKDPPLSSPAHNDYSAAKSAQPKLSAEMTDFHSENLADNTSISSKLSGSNSEVSEKFLTKNLSVSSQEKDNIRADISGSRCTQTLIQETLCKEETNFNSENLGDNAKISLQITDSSAEELSTKIISEMACYDEKNNRSDTIFDNKDSDPENLKNVDEMKQSDKKESLLTASEVLSTNVHSFDLPKLKPLNPKNIVMIESSSVGSHAPLKDSEKVGDKIETCLSITSNAQFSEENPTIKMSPEVISSETKIILASPESSIDEQDKLKRKQRFEYLTNSSKAEKQMGKEIVCEIPNLENTGNDSTIEFSQSDSESATNNKELKLDCNKTVEKDSGLLFQSFEKSIPELNKTEMEVLPESLIAHEENNNSKNATNNKELKLNLDETVEKDSGLLLQSYDNKCDNQVSKKLSFEKSIPELDETEKEILPETLSAHKENIDSKSATNNEELELNRDKTVEKNNGLLFQSSDNKLSNKVSEKLSFEKSIPELDETEKEILPETLSTHKENTDSKSATNNEELELKRDKTVEKDNDLLFQSYDNKLSNQVSEKLSFEKSIPQLDKAEKESFSAHEENAKNLSDRNNEEIQYFKSELATSQPNLIADENEDESNNKYQANDESFTESTHSGIKNLIHFSDKLTEDSFQKTHVLPENIQHVDISVTKDKTQVLMKSLNKNENSDFDELSDISKKEEIDSETNSQSNMTLTVGQSFPNLRENTVIFSATTEKNDAHFDTSKERSETDLFKESSKALETSENLIVVPEAIEKFTVVNSPLSQCHDSTSTSILEKDANNKNKSDASETFTDNSTVDVYKETKILDEVSGEFVSVDSLSNTICSSSETIDKPVKLVDIKDSDCQQNLTNPKNLKRKHDDSGDENPIVISKSIKLSTDSDIPKTDESVNLNTEQSQLVVNNPSVEFPNEIIKQSVSDQSNVSTVETKTIHKNTYSTNDLGKTVLNPEYERKVESVEMVHSEDKLSTKESSLNSLALQTEENKMIKCDIANPADCSRPGSSKTSPSKRKIEETEESKELKKAKTNSPPVREYLDQFVPFLLEGLLKIAYNRPEDPIQYLAEWMIFNKDEAYKRIRVAR